MAEWRRPLTLTELHSFLGFASYYCRFVEVFPLCATPLHKLVGVLQSVKKGAGTSSLEVCWDDACEMAFVNLKHKIVSAPVLGYAYFSKTFSLEIDASHTGFRAVLSQEH